MAADASFNTETLSMSSGLSLSSPPIWPRTPSTTTNTSLLPVVASPLMEMLDPSYPGSPPRLVAISPENLQIVISLRWQPYYHRWQRMHLLIQRHSLCHQD